MRLLMAFLFLISSAYAQEAAPIKDNSFLVEEAYNQERGVVQHIGVYRADRTLHDGTFVFTQEWPFISSRHQLSYSLPITGASPRLENVILNYRYQLLQQNKIFLAPRLTAILPAHTSSSGIEFNLPLSLELNDSWVMHVNAGGNSISINNDTDAAHARTTSFISGLSFIYLSSTVFNILNEFTYTMAKTHNRESVETVSSFTWNPGVRFAVNFSSGTQLVPGLSFPLQTDGTNSEVGILFYLSFEHPFKKIK